MKSEYDDKINRVPWWFTLLLILVVVPGLIGPFMTSSLPASESELRILIKALPIEALGGGCLAWWCYSRTRMTIAWILLSLLVLNDLCLLVA